MGAWNMNDAVEKVSNWLLEKVSQAPPKLRAIYVEWNNSYLEPNTPREIEFVCINAFGFEDVSKDNFDCSDPDEELSRLGDFTWEGPPGFCVRTNEYPGCDWTEVLKTAAIMPAVRQLVRKRDLLFL